VVARLLAVLDAPEAGTGTAYENALRDIMRRLALVTSPENTLQVADGLRKALLFTLWHMSAWERGETLTQNDYVVVRMNDDGGPWLTAYAPACRGYSLPRLRCAARGCAPCRSLSRWRPGLTMT
jgi:Terpene synthase family 2, C-terminal metal binding